MRPAECLEGLELSDGWKVGAIMHKPPTATGGKFSVGYKVIHSNGREAYLKALDFSLAFQQPDFTRALEDLLKAYNFECDLLDLCKENNLRRVVTPIARGAVKVPGNFNEELSNVVYMIFELAKGDIRNEVNTWQQFDFAWALRSMHQSATGLQELHLVGIAHQDVKPSNVLVFPMGGSKLTDLGRASHARLPSQIDEFLIPGDISYAAPEQLYNWCEPRQTGVNQATNKILFRAL